MPRVRYIEEGGQTRFAIVPMQLWQRAMAALKVVGNVRVDSIGQATAPSTVASSTGRAIVAWREQRALSQAQLARDAGISKAYLSQIEKGTRHGSVRALRAIAHALDVSLDQIVD